MPSLENFALEKLETLESQALRRELQITARHENAVVYRNGQRMVSFSCNDYLNLSTHPEIIAAAVMATKAHGAGAGGSRAVTGNHPLYAALESRLAALKGTQDTVVFGSGYLANSGVIPALMSREDVIFTDALAHACIWAGAKLSGAQIVTFPHNNTAALAQLLRTRRAAHRNAMIVTETVFSMDGDRAPLGTLTQLAAAHDAWLMTDDAHGLGVVPADPASHLVPLQMGTLSKAAGGYGGYLCASRNVTALIRNRARSFIYTTGLPPGSIAAASAALDFIAANPDYAALPLAKARLFTSILGMQTAMSPIVPLIIGEAEAALAASRQLAAAGFLVTAIRPPTVPAGTARLRFTFTAAHQDTSIRQLAAAVKQITLVCA